jgi:hypothetical protein
MGDTGYAHEMARLLDPGRQLLRPGRLIAAQDCVVGGVKSLDVVLGDARSVVILDDSPAVWRQHAANVVVPDRYHYFPTSAAALGESPAAARAARGDEAPPGGTLFALARLLARLHAAYFGPDDDCAAARAGGGAGGSSEPPDVRLLLRSERLRVLAGCTLLFSGVVPLGGAPEANAMWRLALELGAQCTQEAGGSDGGRPTHLLSPAGGTAKARWAAAAGLPCVTPAWLRACAARWERAPEADFPLPSPAEG